MAYTHMRNVFNIGKSWLPTASASLLRPATAPVPVVGSVRAASKKSGGSSRNNPGRPRGKHRGVKKRDGTWVTQGTIIVRQLGLDFHPGLNVGIGRDRTLFAKCHGQVVMTTEKVEPDWDNKIVRRFFTDLERSEDVPLYKTYFHVLAEPQKMNFRLVDEI